MSDQKIALAKPSFGREELAALERVLQSGWVAQGKEVENLELEVARLHRAEHGVAVSSATAGLHLACLALEIGPGDRVFIPSFAWPSAANMAVRVGARPVFVDVDARSYNLTPAALKNAIDFEKSRGQGKLKALVIVHEFGLPAELDGLLEIANEEGLEVIEDAACALGASYQKRPVGTLGKLGMFSFHPRKSITTGEGGVVVTNDSALAEKIRVLRNHGQTLDSGLRRFREAGFNYRLTDLQAAVGNAQLKRFPEILARRNDVARWYHELSGGTGCFQLPPLCEEHTWQTFMVVVNDAINRNHVISECAKAGIEVGLGSVAAHSLDFFQNEFGYEKQSCPVSQKLFEQGLALPMHAHLTRNDCSRVVEQLMQVATHH